MTHAPVGWPARPAAAGATGAPHQAAQPSRRADGVTAPPEPYPAGRHRRGGQVVFGAQLSSPAQRVDTFFSAASASAPFTSKVRMRMLTSWKALPRAS